MGNLIYFQTSGVLLYFLLFDHAMPHAGPQIPSQASNLCPLQWKLGVLITDSPGKSLDALFIYFFNAGWPQCDQWKMQRNIQFSSVQSCLTLCDPMNRSMPGLPIHHQLPESTQTPGHRVRGALQPSHPLSSSCPQSFPASGSFQRSQSSHPVAKVLEFQLQHQSFQ